MKHHFTSFMIAPKKHLWNQLKEHTAKKTIAIPVLTTQSAFLGFNKLSKDYFFINHLILIFKFYIYDARNKGRLNIAHLKAIIDKTKNIEKKTSKSTPNKRSKYLKTAVAFLKIIL